MLTDFIHVGESPSVPLWYDALMLSSFAWTALLLGFASLYLVQMIVPERSSAPRGRGLVSSWCWRSRASASTSAGSCASTAGTRRLRPLPGRVVGVIARTRLEATSFRHPRLGNAVATRPSSTSFLLTAHLVGCCVRRSCDLRVFRLSGRGRSRSPARPGRRTRAARRRGRRSARRPGSCRRRRSRPRAAVARACSRAAAGSRA